MICFLTITDKTSGGDGGRGGNVYVEVDGEMNSLLPFRKLVHFRAGRGGHGQGQQMAGVKGEDIVVKVPSGMVVRSLAGGMELLELMKPGQRALLLPGGQGAQDCREGGKGSKNLQAWSELQSPILVELGKAVDEKKCMVCETVNSEFKEIVSMCGGPEENSRANRLLEQLMLLNKRMIPQMIFWGLSINIDERRALKGKSVMDAALEDRICDLYDLHVEVILATHHWLRTWAVLQKLELRPILE